MRRAFDAPIYRRTLNAGIAAVKGGDLVEDRLLLRKAAAMKPTDPLPWLSVTTRSRLVVLSATVLLLALYLLRISFGGFGL